MRASQSTRGFTLIEIMTAMLVLFVLLGISMAFFTSAMTQSHIQECEENMQTIGNAEEQYKIDNVTGGSHVYTTNLANLSSEIPAIPVCPDGGTYSVTISTGASVSRNGQTVPSGYIVVSCSASGHGVFAPEFDTP